MKKFVFVFLVSSSVFANPHLDIGLTEARICVLQKDFILSSFDHPSIIKIVSTSYLQSKFREKIQNLSFEHLSSYLSASCAMSEHYRKNVTQLYKASKDMLK